MLIRQAQSDFSKIDRLQSRQPVLAVASGGGADDDWEEF
jgi:hypothetical protein